MKHSTNDAATQAILACICSKIKLINGVLIRLCRCILNKKNTIETYLSLQTRIQGHHFQILSACEFFYVIASIVSVCYVINLHNHIEKSKVRDL